MSALAFTLRAGERVDDPLRCGAVTIDLTSHFLKRARSEVTMVGRCTKHGKSRTFCEGEIVDIAGTVVADARGVFKPMLRQGRASDRTSME